MLSAGRVQVEPIPGVEAKVGMFDFGAQAARIKNNNVMMINRVLEYLYVVILLLRSVHSGMMNNVNNAMRMNRALGNLYRI
jgi:hypothetical protein